jgi:hypothetical protein
MASYRKILTITAAGCMLVTASCKKYLNVNQNPNVSPSATSQSLLPSAEGYLAQAIGVDCDIYGSIWVQHWTQSPSASQYKTFEQYQPLQSDFERPWLALYQSAENLDQLYTQAGVEHKKQYQAISLLLKAYAFETLTDGWGDVPFSEALKAQPKQGGIVNPHFDMQKMVYAGIIALIDSGNKMINASDASLPGADDQIYGGDMTKWQKFAYTLKLRCLLRLAYIDPGTAQAGIAALPAAGSGAYIAEGDDAQMNFTSSAGNKNPLYAQAVALGGTQNLIGSSTTIDTMNNDEDYRAYIFYEYVLTSGVVKGLQQGNYNTATSASAFSIPSAYTGADAQDQLISSGLGKFSSAQAPVKFLTSYESYFLQAEAAARGWSAGDDAGLFLQGIHANFFAYTSAFADENILWADTTGLSAGDTLFLPSLNPLLQPVYLTADFAYYTYLHGDTVYSNPPSAPIPAYWSQYPSGGSIQDKLRFIITQKWLCMCGNQGFEAWTEWRRTGFPDFLVISVAARTNQIPVRFLYPYTEATENTNYPGLQPVTSRVWWDVN